MKHFKTIFTALLMALYVSVSPYAADVAEPGSLAIGDPAPGLAVEFVQGKPVAVAKGDNVFVVEFWATWCGPCMYSIPHLTALQKKYEKDGLVVIGVSDESKETVAPFIAKKGDEMQYRVAIDPGNVTWQRYAGAFGTEGAGIPQAFVMNKEGRIVWQGHPMDEEMEVQIASLLGKSANVEEGSESKKEEGSDTK